jgi:hypothetical protein
MRRLSHLLAGLSLVGLLGCAETVRESARQAAPAAIESGVKEAHDPATRDRIAEVLKDPEIREATAALSRAVADGVFDSLTEPERVAGADAAGDAFVSRLGSSFASSLRKDIGPALSATIADAVDRSVDRALDVQTEQRLEQIALAVTRGALSGMVGTTAGGQADPAGASLAVRRIAHDVAREAALGVEDAVQTSVRKEDSGQDTQGNVLAAAGRAADVTLDTVPVVFWAILAVAVFIAVAAVILALYVLGRQRRLTTPRAPSATEPYLPDVGSTRAHS